ARGHAYWPRAGDIPGAADNFRASGCLWSSRRISVMRKQHDVLSVEWIKLELIRTAYATRGGLFAALDPRAVIVWYLMLAIAPWFTHNMTALAGFFALGALSVVLA